MQHIVIDASSEIPYGTMCLELLACRYFSYNFTEIELDFCWLLTATLSQQQRGSKERDCTDNKEVWILMHTCLKRQLRATAEETFYCSHCMSNYSKRLVQE